MRSIMHEIIHIEEHGMQALTLRLYKGIMNGGDYARNIVV